MRENQQSMLLVRSCGSLFIRLLGWEWGCPQILLLLAVSGLEGSILLKMEDSAGGQPASNPAAGHPSNVPSGGSASAWRSFEERVLLEPTSSSGESSESSVNQQPVIPPAAPPVPVEVPQPVVIPQLAEPLILDDTRQNILYNRYVLLNFGGDDNLPRPNGIDYRKPSDSRDKGRGCFGGRWV